MVVVVVAVNEHDEVRILFNSAGFAQVAHHRSFVGALFQRTIELRECNHRHVEFLGQRFETTRNFRNFGGAIFLVAGHLHQLQVVNDNEAQVVFALESPRARAQLAR